MTDKELRKLRRQELLELLLEQSKEVKTLHRQIRDLEDQAYDLDHANTWLKRRLDAKDEKLERLKTRLNEKDEHFGSLKEKLDEKDAKFARLTGRLDEKDAQIEHLKRRLDEKDARIAALGGGAEESEEP